MDIGDIKGDVRCQYHGAFGMSKTQAYRSEVVSLVGLLNFVTKCARLARIFMSRMFDFMKE